jgi:hypothetical protein
MEKIIPTPVAKEYCIGEHKFLLQEPDVDDIITFQQASEDGKISEKLIAMKALGVKMGIPAELVGKIKISSFNDLVVDMMGSDSKKK